MIKWISFILQMLMLKKSFSKSMSTLEYVQRTADRARGYFLFTVGAAVSALFFMTSLIVAVIGIGLQIEQQGYVRFSGLMVSATIFLILALGIFFISLILLGFQKKKIAEEIMARQKQSSTSSLMPMLEEILKQILVNLANPKPPVETERPRTNNHSNSQKTETI